MSKNPKLHFSIVEFRPNPAEHLGAIHLGVLLEFTTSRFWVVGLGLVGVVPSDKLKALDPLSRELVENRSELFGPEIKAALIGAKLPGDVLKRLARTNPWSLHITEPETIDLDMQAMSRDVSVDQALDEHIFSIYQMAMGGEIEHGRNRFSSAPLLHAPEPMIDALSPWMTQPLHWQRPLVGLEA